MILIIALQVLRKLFDTAIIGTFECGVIEFYNSGEHGVNVFRHGELTDVCSIKYILIDVISSKVFYHSAI